MYKKIFISLVLFMIVGEMLIRFDEKFKLLEENRVVKIDTKLEITPEFSMVKNNEIKLDSTNLRIMVLGDSYIHGGGIEFKDNFSQQLKILLQKSNDKFKDVYVLDVSKSSSNNFDNNQTYFQFADRFLPQIVILGYNYNDVMGNLDKERKIGNIEDFENVDASSEEKQTFMKKVYDIIYKSRLVHYILHNLHTELKAHGIVFPNSEFSFIQSSYSKHRENWVKSQTLLQEMIMDMKKKNSQLIVLKFPEINLLEHPKLFTLADEEISRFFHQFPLVTYINGADIFKGETSKENMLSKYDGHPNEKAHKKMAGEVATMIDVKK